MLPVPGVPDLLFSSLTGVVFSNRIGHPTPVVGEFEWTSTTDVDELFSTVKYNIEPV
jgi:hypothetical protein